MVYILSEIMMPDVLESSNIEVTVFLQFIHFYCNYHLRRKYFSVLLVYLMLYPRVFSLYVLYVI